MFCTCSFAQDIVVLKKGEPAPFDGVFFSKEAEVKLRQVALDKQALEKQNLTLKDLAVFYEDQSNIMRQRISVQQDQNINLSKQLYDQRSGNFWENAMYFGIGVFVTGAMSYAAFQIYRR